MVRILIVLALPVRFHWDTCSPTSRKPATLQDWSVWDRASHDIFFETVLSDILDARINSLSFFEGIETLPQHIHGLLYRFDIVKITKFFEHGRIRILPLKSLILFKIDFLGNQSCNLFVVIFHNALFLKLGLFFVRSNLQTVDLRELQVNYFLNIVQLNSLPQIIRESGFHVKLALFDSFQIFKISVDKRWYKVVLRISNRCCGPSWRFQLKLVQLHYVHVQILVPLIFGSLHMLLQFFQKSVVPLLLVLHETVIFHRRFQLHHVIANYLLHLHRVEVLLVCYHVPNRIFTLLNLFKFHEKKIIEPFHVLVHIVNSESFV